jgi:hypothetical protein
MQASRSGVVVRAAAKAGNWLPGEQAMTVFMCKVPSTLVHSALSDGQPIA